MAKKNKQKTRLKLNETLNLQLDAMEDNSSLEVFMPKNSTQLDFYNIVNDAIDKEELNNSKSKKVKVKNVSNMNNNSVPIVVSVGILALCGCFVYFVWNMIF